MRRLASVAVLGLALLALAGCGGGTRSAVVAGQEISAAQLSRSASTSSEATSGRFRFDMRFQVPGAADAFAFDGAGAFDKATGRASLKMDMSAFAKMLGGFFSGLGAKSSDAPDFADPSKWQLDVVQDGKVSYVRLPAISSKLPAGKEWVRSEGKSITVHGLEMGEVQPFGSSDPRRVLEVLRAAGGSIETLGAEELRGAETTHYRATIDLNEYARKLGTSSKGQLGSLVDGLATQPGLTSVPIDVWLDESGRVRKLSFEISAPASADQTGGTGAVTLELWDYGSDVEIPLPSPDDVADASAVSG